MVLSESVFDILDSSGISKSFSSSLMTSLSILSRFYSSSLSPSELEIEILSSSLDKLFSFCTLKSPPNCCDMDCLTDVLAFCPGSFETLALIDFTLSSSLTLALYLLSFILSSLAFLSASCFYLYNLTILISLISLKTLMILVTLPALPVLANAVALSPSPSSFSTIAFQIHPQSGIIEGDDQAQAQEPGPHRIIEAVEIMSK